MPDTDRILEAEQSIQSIASELKRMRDAADILQNSQAQVDAVLTSARRVIEVTEKFSNECGVIVTKLAATDLNQILDSLRALHGELVVAAESVKTELQSAFGELQDGVQAGNGHLSSTLKTVDERIQSGLEQLASLAKEQAMATNNAITNIESNNERIQSGLEQLASLAKEQAMATNNAITNIESKLGTLENQLQVARINSGKRQIVTIVLVILTFLAALFLLSKALIPSLGG